MVLPRPISPIGGTDGFGDGITSSTTAKKGGDPMLGMEDWTITIAWLGTVLASLFCIVYGAIRWNEGSDSE